MKNIFQWVLLLTMVVPLLISCGEESEIKDDKKYNIVWIVLEDQSPDFFPMYGDSTISLPATEALASESIIYDNAYANVPVCAPARSTIILGMYTITTGTHNMRTYNAYNPDGEPTINVPSYTPVMKPGVRMFPKYLRAEGYYCSNNAKEDYNLEKTDGAWDESSQEAHWRNKSTRQAFFSIFNLGICHESGVWRFANDSLFVDPAQIKVPPYFPDIDSVRHDMAVNYSNLKRVDDQIAELVTQLKEDNLYDDTYIFFYGDHGGPFPRHKRSLYDTGIRVPFMVKLPKDLQLVSGSSRTDEIVSFVDLAPTVLSIAGIPKPDYMQGKAFLGQNLEEEEMYVFASSDRFDEVYDRKRAVSDGKFKFIRNYKTDVPYALPVSYREQMPIMRNLRRLKAENKLDENQMLWMRDTKVPREFFNVEEDPFELNNLIDDPEYAEQIERLEMALDAWLEEVEDIGGEDEQDLIKRWAEKRQNTKLNSPELTLEGDKINAMLSGEYGHVVYKEKDSEVWNVYADPVVKKEGKTYEFKTVHIGLDDSESVSM